jgi:hypothetical protein
MKLMDLRFTDCRWPVGEADGLNQEFCGERQKDGSPYCPCHARLAVIKTPSIKEMGLGRFMARAA